MGALRPRRKRFPHLRRYPPLRCLTPSRRSPIWLASTRPASRSNPVQRPAQARAQRGPPRPQRPPRRALYRPTVGMTCRSTPTRRQAYPHPNRPLAKKAAISSPDSGVRLQAPVRHRLPARRRPGLASRAARHRRNLIRHHRAPQKMTVSPNLSCLQQKVRVHKHRLRTRWLHPRWRNRPRMPRWMRQELRSVARP